MTHPVLWHIDVSPYNEKVRWALDLKRIPHVRRTTMPPLHVLRAYRLTRGRTFPVLVLDGQAIGDSTSIVETLERRWPEPPLYPEDPDERARALAIEDFFDEELTGYLRRLGFDAFRADRQADPAELVPSLPAALHPFIRVAFRPVSRVFNVWYAPHRQGPDHAWNKLRAALERFRQEVGSSGYFVGERFTIADLTFAACLAPLVSAPGFPVDPPSRVPAGIERVRALCDEYGAREWVFDIYRRHRPPSAAL